MLTKQLVSKIINTKLGTQLLKDIPNLVLSAKKTPFGLLLRTTPRSLRALCLYIRNSGRLQFRTIVDIAVVDKLRTQGRFAVNYLFLSMKTNQRITLQLFVEETDTIPSIASAFVNGQRLFAAAAWLEREVWDMFGLYFSEHGDLRRILTDYGFEGHPLRKDFPLTGFYELMHKDTGGHVVVDTTELAQELRTFHI